MAVPLQRYVRIARLLRIAGALSVIAAITAIVLAFTGDSASARDALQIAVPLGGAALLTAAAFFLQSRRARRQ